MIQLKKTITIAIDGPAAAGKSTVAKIVAEKLSYIYIDTGAMYRAITYMAIQKGVDINDELKLVELLNQIDIILQQGEQEQQVIIDGIDITKEIRSEQVTKFVSHVAKHPKIRQEMVKRQQELARSGGVVMDGRDIGTHVLPNAELKIFLRASVEERAKRRFEENRKKGFKVDLEKVIEEIRQRDDMDINRKVSPLTKASDAIEIDTTSLSIQEVVNKITQLAEEIIDK